MDLSAYIEAQGPVKRRCILGACYLFAFIIGAAFVSAWYLPFVYGLALLIFVPIVWFYMPDRIHAGMFIGGYYFIGMLPLFAAFDSYFTSRFHLLLAIVMWLFAVFLQILPWFLLYMTRTVNWFVRIILMLLMFVVITIPPVGLFNWLSPLNSIGYLFPNFGWWGVLIIIVFLLLACSARQQWRFTGLRMTAAALIFIFAIYINHQFNAPAPPLHWKSVSTRIMPWQQSNTLARDARERNAISMTRQALSLGYEAMVMPGSVLHVWNRDAQQRWQNVFRMSIKNKAIILIALDRYSPVFKARHGYLLVDGGKARFVSSRMPLPFMAWDLLTNNTQVVKNYRVQVIYGYEGATVWMNLLPYFRWNSPQLSILMADLGWANHAIARVYLRTVYSWSRLFGVPLMAAMNMPGFA